MKDKPHDEAMAQLYHEDPDFAIATLNTILRDGDQAELMMVLRQLAKAFGGVQSIAEKAQLNSTQIYRTLSPDGNPALSSFTAILEAMNMRLAVQAVH
jgi:probable addiction module antidote protein